MPQADLQHSFTKTYRKTSYGLISPLRPELSANGSTVIITGGHTGIGRAITESFAQAGASNVIIIARRAELLEKVKLELEAKYSGSRFHVFTASTTDSQRMTAIFDQIRQQIAEPNVLILCAAFIAHKISSDIEKEIEDARQSYETNVVANLDLMRKFVGQPVSGNSITKTVVDINSAAAHVHIPMTAPAYGASKMAFARTLMSIHHEVISGDSAKWPKHLRIFSLHPGGVRTETAGKSSVDLDEFPWDDASLPGDTTVWLASAESDFLRGRFMWANWDAQELLQVKNEIVKDNLLLPGLLGDAKHAVDGAPTAKSYS